MDLIGCGVQKPQELLWAERNHYYFNYFHVFSLVRCINKACCLAEITPPDESSVFQELCSPLHDLAVLSNCCDFFFPQNKRFLGQNVKLASPKAHPVCDHVTQTP